MAARRVDGSGKPARPRQPPARTPQDREDQLVALAVDLAERQMLDGSASSQLITHYLKLGSSRERLEQERMRHEIELMEVKREAMESAARVEEMYAEAMRAFSSYAGNEVPELEGSDEY